MNEHCYEYKDKIYPIYLKDGPGSRFIEPFARFFCKGHGVNIGYGDSHGKIFDQNCLFLDLRDGIDCSALDLPLLSLDFVFSSHCLEHLTDWKSSLNNWVARLRVGGCLFLYLPHHDMEYWRPENNSKHKSIIFEDDLVSFLRKLYFEPLFVTGRDLYWSYSCVGWKTRML